MDREQWLQIWKVNRGWLVKRGCQYLVFGNDEKDRMVEAFGDLMENEDKAGQKWCEGHASNTVEAAQPLERRGY